MTASLAIVFPAYNEEASIERAVREAQDCGRRLVDEEVISGLEIVVVDDGSTDATGRVLSCLQESRQDLVVVTHARNRGLGAAVRSGLDAASKDLVFYTDADLPVDLSVVDSAIALLDDGAEVVSAYRRDRGGEGPRRFVYSLLYNALVRAVLGVDVRDVNFAAKLLRRDVLTGVHLRSEGSFIDVELLARLQRRGHRIVQMPADYHPRSRGVSTLSSAQVIRTILREMFALAPSIRAERPSGSTGC